MRRRRPRKTKVTARSQYFFLIAVIDGAYLEEEVRRKSRLDPFAPTIDLPCNIDKSVETWPDREELFTSGSVIHVLLHGKSFKLSTINDSITR